MNTAALAPELIELIRGVLRQFPNITEARLFGSRAKGNARGNSDIDIALWGTDRWQDVAAVIGELEELPVANRFDVVAYAAITNEQLRDHIDRVGMVIYQAG